MSIIKLGRRAKRDGIRIIMLGRDKNNRMTI